MPSTQQSLRGLKFRWNERNRIFLLESSHLKPEGGVPGQVARAHEGELDAIGSVGGRALVFICDMVLDSRAVGTPHLNEVTLTVNLEGKTNVRLALLANPQAFNTKKREPE